MDNLQKILVFLVIIVVFLLLFVPSTSNFEYFGNIYLEQTAKKFQKKSTYIYARDDITDETSYMKEYQIAQPISDEPLIMNRCLELSRGQLDSVIKRLRKGEFFISEKVSLSYIEFTTVQQEISNTLLKMYDNSKSTVPVFYGPVYVLITQYPIMRKIAPDKYNKCATKTLPLSYSSANKVIERDPYCSDVSRELDEANIRCEYYILMPSHLATMQNNVVGAYNYKKWEDVKYNMAPLLEDGDISVINTRSKENRCFTTCGITSNDLYFCGSANSKENVDSSEKTDFVNLYTLNTKKMNSILGTSMLNSGVQIEPIEPSVESSVLGDYAPAPSSSPAPAIFMSDEQAYCYLRRYPDLKRLARKYSHEEDKQIEWAKQHWETEGINENRINECNDMLSKMTDSEAVCYVDRYADLQTASASFASEPSKLVAWARTHWNRYGYNENRIKSC